MPSLEFAKVATLIVKVVTKPLVESMKSNAHKNPFWRDSIMLRIARKYNKASLRFRYWRLGVVRSKEQLTKAAQMKDEAALQLGSEIVAVFGYLTVGVFVLLMQQLLVSSAEPTIDYNDHDGDPTAGPRTDRSQRLGESVALLDKRIKSLEEHIQRLNRVVALMKAREDVATASSSKVKTRRNQKRPESKQKDDRVQLDNSQPDFADSALASMDPIEKLQERIFRNSFKAFNSEDNDRDKSDQYTPGDGSEKPTADSVVKVEKPNNSYQDDSEWKDDNKVHDGLENFVDSNDRDFVEEFWK